MTMALTAHSCKHATLKKETACGAPAWIATCIHLGPPPRRGVDFGGMGEVYVAIGETVKAANGIQPSSIQPCGGIDAILSLVYPSRSSSQIR